MPLSPSSMTSSIPHFYSNYTFTPSDLVDFATTTPTTINCSINNNNYALSLMDNFAVWGGGSGGGQECFFTNNNNNNNSPIFDNGALDQVVSLDSDTISSNNWMSNNFCDQLGGGAVSPDFSVPAISDGRMGFYGGGNSTITGFNHHQGLRYQPRIGEFGEECCGFVVEDIKPQHYSNAARDNWGIQGNQMAAVEEPNIKVGRYSEEERKERILRYLKKRNQRNFNKTIKYACRKTLADRRVRVRGRFARNNELICEEENIAAKKHIENHHLIKEDFDSIQFQIKNDDEDWLQEAMASLVYLSQSSPEDM